MNKLDRKTVKEIITDENMTSMAMITYLSAVMVAKEDNDGGYPYIDNFTVYSFYKSMNDKMDWINRSSVELAIKVLQDNGYCKIEGRKLLVFKTGIGHVGSDEYFKSEGYMKLHLFMFEKVFFKLPLRAKKLCLYMTMRCDGKMGKRELVNVKSKKSPENFEFFSKFMKVNRLSHIKEAFKTLSKLFNICELDNNTFKFSLNQLSKDIFFGKTRFFKYTQAQLEKVESLFEKFDSQNFGFRHDQIQDVTEVVKDCGYKLREAVVKELCKSNRSGVRNMLGYALSVVSRVSKLALE